MAACTGWLSERSSRDAVSAGRLWRWPRAGLAEHHDRTYLTTQITSWIAIRIYLDFGFKPLILEEKYKKAWKLMADHLKHPALREYA